MSLQTVRNYNLGNKKSYPKSTNLLNETEIDRLKKQTGLSERSIRQAFMTFQQFDINNDGSISRNELQNALYAMGIKQSESNFMVQQLLQRIIATNDQSITLFDFIQLIQEQANKRAELEVNRDQKKKTFDIINILDAFVAMGGNPDQTGRVKAQNVKNVVETYGLSVDIDALMMLLDRDGNGAVDFQEFSFLFSESSSVAKK